jgi:hypothetical protein
MCKWLKTASMEVESAWKKIPTHRKGGEWALKSFLLIEFKNSEYLVRIAKRC